MNQSNSNTMKLVVCKGMQEYEMLRLFMTIENKQAEKFQFYTGQTVISIVQEVLYRDTTINVIAHPYIPQTNSLCFAYDFSKSTSTPAVVGLQTTANSVINNIQQARTKLNTMD